ncbi:nuclease-related domain-containing protein [Mesobacillus subterraneus]|uniref:nuclease-related domain-containing protein n=1 Tax=Mesobacillus subterraneus TaxID=285983 RepID=UPI001CFCAFA7|nr:nuclease-related domain-containing protein [Mesobacillus subterraneus]WLR56283.1 nuclease-related domain-containing protein [Mesobacillus subterraneus]
MFKKDRYESEELRVFKVLNRRMDLTEKEKQYYFNLKKGFEGEVMFDGYLRQIFIQSYILNDLLFEQNHSHFQIDSLMISQILTYLFEVKYFEGEYYFDGDQFKTIKGKEVKNPLLQLERNESLLRQFFNSIGFKVPIEAYLVFVNPDFTLYQAPLNRRIILPTNLNRFIHKMNNQKSTLNSQHSRLSEKLLSSHLTKSPFTKIPAFEYSQLRKGVFCHSCGTVMEEYSGVILTCKKCGKHENTKEVLLRSIEELQILYPTKKISTNTIYEWCGEIFPKLKIQQLLKENFIMSGYGQWSYYN